MKTLTFGYTKKDGSVSERTLLAMVTPNDGKYYAGIDISTLDPVTAAEFSQAAADLHAKYLADLKELQTSFDLKHNYRQFLAEGMEDITEV